MTVTYRIARPEDAAAIADLGTRAFRAAFAHLYTAQDLETFLAEEHSAAKVAKQLADPGMLTQVAEDGEDTLLGFCKLVLDSGLKHHATALRPLELKQIYLDPERTGGGIGQAMMHWTLDVAHERGADEVQLSVWSGNHGAQRFYERWGFTKVADITFQVGEQIDEEFLFALKL